MAILIALLLSLGLGGLLGIGSDDGDNVPQLPDDDETATLSNGNDTYEGGSGDDSIDGGRGYDTLSGNGGDDSLFGGAGKDVLEGGAGDDLLDGGSFDDILDGGDGDDDIFGGNSVDTIYGGDDDDFIQGGDGDDRILGGDGRDYIEGNDGTDRIRGADGNDIIVGGDNTPGTTGEEQLFGGEGNDLLIGGAGVDRLEGDGGNDTLIGSDVATLTPQALALLRGELTENDLAEPFITLEEETGPDTDVDSLIGGNGEDVLVLGGHDVAQGGADSDLFLVGTDWIDTTDGSAVQIKDLQLDEDVIVIAYDADDGPPVISYEQNGTSTVNVFADGKLVVEVTRYTSIGLRLTPNDVDALLRTLPMNPPDGV